MVKLASAWRQVMSLFGHAWKSFLAVHVAATLTSALVLMPLLALLTSGLMLLSGNAALTDQDILFFVLTPSGFSLALVAASVLATFLVFGTALMFLYALAVKRGYQPGLRSVLHYVFGRFIAIFQLAAQMILRALAVAAPFLLLAGYLFLRNLTEYDINYYLAEHPPEFVRTALAIAAILLVMAVLLLRMFSGWVLALPKLLLGEGSASQVLALSREQSKPLIKPLSLLLVSWLLVSSLLLGAWGLAIDALTEQAIGLAGQSLVTAAWLMAGLLLLWTVGNILLGFLTGTVFVLALVVLFDAAFPRAGEARLLQLENRQSLGGGPRRWGVATAVLVVVALLGSALAMAALESRLAERPDPQIMAHRGASFEAPENTLAAIELAIEQGAHWVEIDVQETADGQIVVIHDRDLMKLAGVADRVGESTAQQLQSIDIGSWKDPRFSAERIPTLAQVLELTRDRIGVNVELKYYGHEQALERRVVQVVEQAGVEQQVIFMSLYYPGVLALRELRPDWTVGLLASVSLGALPRLEADFFAVNARFVNRSLLKASARRGKKVYAWTVNDPVLVAAMASAGVDALITDRPGLARDVLAQRDQLSTLERLLVGVASLIGSDAQPQ